MPPRFKRPELSSDEGGLWALMDREETRLRRSPFALRDAPLRDYVQDIACRLASAHCPDVRVYLVQTPLFNANMAPNGMMQVWTGLLLRAENEAQLAAVIGHEIGHYLARHTLERMRDVRSRTAFGQFLSLFGVAGAVGQLAALASLFAYSREQEREADRIGAVLMRQAGYDATEASSVWRNLLLEIKARPDGDQSRIPMFATHPTPEERQETLQQLARDTPGGVTNQTQWIEKTRPYMHGWLTDEIKRGQHEESIALFTRMINLPSTRSAEFLYARGEVYRLRATGTDLDAALADYEAAVSVGGEPAETHRGLGAIYRLRNQRDRARASFLRYLESAPEAPDSAMIRSYVQALGT